LKYDQKEKAGETEIIKYDQNPAPPTFFLLSYQI